MFNSDYFELPLEKQLRLRVITKEIEECTNVDELKKQLIQCAESLMKYQHLSAKLAEEKLADMAKTLFSTMGVEVIAENDE